MHRHSSGSSFPKKEPHEHGPPFDENLYKVCEGLTKNIYAVTIKDRATVKDEKKDEKAGRG